MDAYQKIVLIELKLWQKQVQAGPGFFSRLSKKTQRKINSYIPEKIHAAITTVIKKMVQGVLYGSQFTSTKPLLFADFFTRESSVRQKIKNYRTTASIEGGITGAGGLVLGLADFPILLSIKVKLLFEIASIYGFDTSNYKERVFLLHIFELAFSSQEHRNQIYQKIENWHQKTKDMPDDINQFDWRSFQQEYRDYLDLAKMAQLLPVIGAPVGLIVNYRLIKKLGITAMNAYRMRLLTNN